MICGKLYQYYHQVPSGQRLWQKVNAGLEAVFEKRKTPMRRSKLIVAIEEEVKKLHHIGNCELFRMSAFEILEMRADLGELKKTIRKGRAYFRL